MSSRKRNASDDNRAQRRRDNFNDVIVISDDEPEDGLVADSPLSKSVTPRRRTTRTRIDAPQNSNMRGCWPFKKKKSMLQGQSSHSSDHVRESFLRSKSTDHFQPIFVNNFPHTPPTVLQEPIQLSQYRLENPYSKSILPELNQCGWCLQKIPKGHPNYMPLMAPLPVESLSDDDYEEALESYKTIGNTDPQPWKDWWYQSFNTPPHKR